MTEQELRERMGSPGPRLELLEREEYVAILVLLDDETLAIRIFYVNKPSNTYDVVYDWRVVPFNLAVSILAWADNGGNWR